LTTNLPFAININEMAMQTDYYRGHDRHSTVKKQQTSNLIPHSRAENQLHAFIRRRHSAT